MILLLLLLMALLMSCRREVRPAKVPLDTLWYRQDTDRDHARLFVLLPGKDSRHDDFAENGFVDEVRKRSMHYDLVAVDAHLGYYMNNSIVQRLKEDVIAPSRSEGYEEIWLVGISLGSISSLLYLKNYPDDISGILLLGPFLGDRDLIDEIRFSGGLERWNPGEISGEDWQRELWLYLKYLIEEGVEMPLYVAYGANDPYAYGPKVLTPHLPPDRVITVFGGHTWGPWRSLWSVFLDSLAR